MSPLNNQVYAAPHSQHEIHWFSKFSIPLLSNLMRLNPIPWTLVKDLDGSIVIPKRISRNASRCFTDKQRDAARTIKAITISTACTLTGLLTSSKLVCKTERLSWWRTFSFFNNIVHGHPHRPANKGIHPWEVPNHAPHPARRQARKTQWHLRLQQVKPLCQDSHHGQNDKPVCGVQLD